MQRGTVSRPFSIFAGTAFGSASGRTRLKSLETDDHKLAHHAVLAIVQSRRTVKLVDGRVDEIIRPVGKTVRPGQCVIRKQPFIGTVGAHNADGVIRYIGNVDIPAAVDRAAI